MLKSRYQTRSASFRPRQDKRYTDPVLSLIIGERHFRTLDWSFGGCRIDGIHAGLVPGQQVEGMVAWDAEAPFVAEIISRNEREVWTALRFIDLTNAAFAAMESALTKRERAVQ